jgi:dipeptidyl aminopeptidase/acylaminoacyl peptidase
MDTRGGRPSLFLKDGEAPAWSPDGSRLAFNRTVDGNTDVYSVASDGSDLQQLTIDVSVDTDPAWGPDGTQVVFASDRDGDFDIYTMDPDGSDQQALTETALDERDPYEVWTWRTVGFDQGPDGEELMCQQTLGPPSFPGDPVRCDTSGGGHSYAMGTYSPFAWLVAQPNGRSHLWAEVCCDPERQLTSGRRTDSDPVVRPATPEVVAHLSRAAGDLDVGVRAAQAWVDANGSGTGADAGPSGLITEAPGLCLVDDMEVSSVTTSTCDAGVGTGSTSVYADADTIALARDTGLGTCLWAVYRSFWVDWEAQFGTTAIAGNCTGQLATQATASGWY